MASPKECVENLQVKCSGNIVHVSWDMLVDHGQPSSRLGANRGLKWAYHIKKPMALQLIVPRSTDLKQPTHNLPVIDVGFSISIPPIFSFSRTYEAVEWTELGDGNNIIHQVVINIDKLNYKLTAQHDFVPVKLKFESENPLPGEPLTAKISVFGDRRYNSYVEISQPCEASAADTAPQAVQVTIPGNLDSDELEQLVIVLAEYGIEDIEITDVRAGSMIITMKMSQSDVDQFEMLLRDRPDVFGSYQMQVVRDKGAGKLVDNRVFLENIIMSNVSPVYRYVRQHLSGADLSRLDLRGADLHGVDLSRANLTSTNLKDADLQGANLRGANLEDATLPDGSRWTPEADLRRFVNQPPRPVLDNPNDLSGKERIYDFLTEADYVSRNDIAEHVFGAKSLSSSRVDQLNELVQSGKVEITKEGHGYAYRLVSEPKTMEQVVLDLMTLQQEKGLTADELGQPIGLTMHNQAFRRALSVLESLGKLRVEHVSGTPVYHRTQTL